MICYIGCDKQKMPKEETVDNHEQQTICFLLLTIFSFCFFLLFVGYEVWFVFFMECQCLNQELEMERCFRDYFLWSDEDDVEGWMMRLRLEVEDKC